MSLLFETIRIQDGIPLHLEWHVKRMRDAGCGMQDAGSRMQEAGWRLPDNMKKGIVRCNVIYEKEILEITFSPYIRKEIRSLRLVNAEDLDYCRKFLDRSALDELFEKRGNCDDIAIIRNGYITDSSMANLIFFDGNRWVTPDTPLLGGTCRARMIAQGELFAESIRANDLNRFQGCKLINAMRFPGEQEMIPLSMISR